jgi:hypothetical protein
VISVIVRRHLYVSAPAPVGIYCMETTRSVHAVPRAGDWIELADGWASARVRDCTFMERGSRVIIELDNVKTDNPAMIAEDHQLVDDHRWHWVGPAPDRPLVTEEP